MLVFPMFARDFPRYRDTTYVTQVAPYRSLEI
jgi:hypothetical protein